MYCRYAQKPLSVPYPKKQFSRHRLKQPDVIRLASPLPCNGFRARFLVSLKPLGKR